MEQNPLDLSGNGGNGGICDPEIAAGGSDIHEKPTGVRPVDLPHEACQAEDHVGRVEIRAGHAEEE